jgi:small subunit ribosomal protein S16
MVYSSLIIAPPEYPGSETVLIHYPEFPPAGSLPWSLAGLRRSRRVDMSAAIRLKKFGTKKRPYYRIVVMDKRSARDGKAIEELGYYHPIEAVDKQILFDADKVRSWVDKGATVSDTVRNILNKKNFSL